MKAKGKNKFKMLKITPELHTELTRIKSDMKLPNGKPMTFEGLFSLLTKAEKYYRVASRNYFGKDLAKARGYSIERSAKLGIKTIEWPEVFVYLGTDDGKD